MLLVVRRIRKSGHRFLARQGVCGGRATVLLRLTLSGARLLLRGVSQEGGHSGAASRS
jgi:hypothetical protein